MDLQTRKLHFIEEILSISNDKIIERLESVLKEEQQKLDPVLKEKLTSRALKANEDIKAGRVYSREEAEKTIKERMGI
jgi:CHASE3 domain sensor protein